MRFCSSKYENLSTDRFDCPHSRFQLTGAGNLHVQLFQQSNDPNEEKTWNPNPDRLRPVMLTDLDSFPIFNVRLV